MKKLLAAALLVAAFSAQAAFVLTARLWETTATGGTGALTLGGAQSNYRAFSSAMSTGDTVWYFAVNRANPTTQWESGIGTYNSGSNTITRTTILDSSNSGSAVNFAASTTDIFSDLPAKVMNFTGDCALSSSGVVACQYLKAMSAAFAATNFGGI